MSTPVTLRLYAAGLALVSAAALGLGSAVGPVGPVGPVGTVGPARDPSVPAGHVTGTAHTP